MNEAVEDYAVPRLTIERLNLEHQTKQELRKKNTKVVLTMMYLLKHKQKQNSISTQHEIR